MPCLSYTRRKELPPSPGIYFIGNTNAPVMYVGLSKSLRERHRNHHRLSQFESIESVEIRYQPLPTEILGKVQDLGGVLRRLEQQAINYYKPPINNTAVPDESTAVSLHGPVYLQTHNIENAGYCDHFNAFDGDEIGINTTKLSLITRAIDERRPVFLIASGFYRDYERSGYHNLFELEAFKREKIYVLVSRFIPYKYENVGAYKPYYLVYGGTSRVFRSEYLILNNQPGFSEFKKSYLCLGFTNCERSDFAERLLLLGGLKLLGAA